MIAEPGLNGYFNDRDLNSVQKPLPGAEKRVVTQQFQMPMRDVPRILLEELDGDDVVVRIQATPERAADGPKLATEVLAAVAPTARGEQIVSNGSRDSD